MNWKHKKNFRVRKTGVARNFCVLILYPSSLSNSLITPGNFLVAASYIIDVTQKVV